jgi:quinol monooxygenase YgiN
MRLSHLVLGAVMLVAAGVSAARADNAAIYQVSYFEAAAPEGAATAKLARQFAAASRKEPGNLGFAVLREIGRPSRFAIYEGWRDKAAADAHAAAASAFRDKLAPMLVGPFEIRSFDGLALAEPTGRGNPRAVWTVTHVDVFPSFKDKAAGLVTALAQAGRKMPGNISFDVLRVQGHPNHFTLVEGWQDRGAFETSLMAAPTKDFRTNVTPLEGALYDERVYRRIG